MPPEGAEDRGATNFRAGVVFATVTVFMHLLCGARRTSSPPRPATMHGIYCTNATDWQPCDLVRRFSGYAPKSFEEFAAA